MLIGASLFMRNGGKFVAVAGGISTSAVAAYSTDGVNWTQSTLPASAGWQSVTYG